MEWTVLDHFLHLYIISNLILNAALLETVLHRNVKRTFPSMAIRKVFFFSLSLSMLTGSMRKI